jgi:N-acetylmuramoyl-L-alanine amidase
MKIAISSGHGKYIRGASASPRPPFLDEVDEARRVVNRVAELWRSTDVGVQTFHDDTSTSQSQNLNAIVNWHNWQNRDYDVSVHFNAYQKTDNPMGVEVLYVTQQKLAADTSLAIAQAGGLSNRGAKKRTDLAFLNGTNKPAILLEICFVDSSRDADLYRRQFEAICKRIAEVIGGVTIGAPLQRPHDPEPISPPLGDAVIEGEGPETPAVPVFAANHCDILCTVFGGKADPNDSAYPPYDTITDTEISCALPYKWRDKPPPMVLVYNPRTGKDVTCRVRDVGPWLTDDEAYVLGTARPLAETSPLPRGPHKGKKSNGAGIDLTPAAAKAIDLSGLEPVDWTLVEEIPVA